MLNWYNAFPGPVRRRGETPLFGLWLPLRAFREVEEWKAEDCCEGKIGARDGARNTGGRSKMPLCVDGVQFRSIFGARAIGQVIVRTIASVAASM